MPLRLWPRRDELLGSGFEFVGYHGGYVVSEAPQLLGDSLTR